MGVLCATHLNLWVWKVFMSWTQSLNGRAAWAMAQWQEQATQLLTVETSIQMWSQGEMAWGHAQKGRLWTHPQPPVTTRLCIKGQLWLWQAQWMPGNVQAMLIQWLLKGEDGAMKKPTGLPTPRVINHCDQVPNPCCGRDNVYSGRVRQAPLSIRNTNNFRIT